MITNFSQKLENEDTGISMPEDKPCKACVELKIDDMRDVYLDHNSTTYIRREISNLLEEYDKNRLGFGNASIDSAYGHYAENLIWDSRQKIARCISVKPEEIYFTGSGSEANNLAIKGIAFSHFEKKGHIITSKTEHYSVLKAIEYLETLGFEATYLDVDRFGMVSLDSVRAAIRENTILVSIMTANNEIGTINPIFKIGELCHKHGIPFMTDAIQAYGKIPLNPKVMGVSLMTFSGHKIYAPKGVGGIYVEKGLSLLPLIHGGGQEGGLRSGTENIGGIVALGNATELSHFEMQSVTLRYLKLRDLFLEGLSSIEPDYILNGSLDYRVPGNLSIGFPSVDSRALVKSLEKIGVSVSAGSACSSKRFKTSHVLEAIGADTENYATIRMSFGLKTIEEDIKYLLKYLKILLPMLKG